MSSSTGISSRRSSSTGIMSSSFFTASRVGEESTSEGENPTGDGDITSSHSHPDEDEIEVAANDPDEEGDAGVCGRVLDAERPIEEMDLSGNEELLVERWPELEKEEKRDESKGLCEGDMAVDVLSLEVDGIGVVPLRGCSRSNCGRSSSCRVKSLRWSKRVYLVGVYLSRA